MSRENAENDAVNIGDCARSVGLTAKGVGVLMRHRNRDFSYGDRSHVAVGRSTMFPLLFSECQDL